jgi:hypothetical protein
MQPPLLRVLLIGTLTALVLGLLIAAASSSFNTKNQEVVLIAADVIQMDHLLRRYGPEAEGLRMGRELTGSDVRVTMTGGDHITVIHPRWSTRTNSPADIAFERREYPARYEPPRLTQTESPLREHTNVETERTFL